MGNSARIYCLLARKGSNAVIIRRGPSKQVCLIKWDRKNDTFDEGQWFKGRIYERRCDLSPDGSKLIYFAANWSSVKTYKSWTAVSKPPYLTALALWPKENAWGGGGLFEDDNTILLNHHLESNDLAKNFTLPKNIKILPLREHSGHGEDFPINDIILSRDGWKHTQEGTWKEHSYNAKMWKTLDPPMVYTKKFKYKDDQVFKLHMIHRGIKEKDGSWYVIDYFIEDKKGNFLLTLKKSDWADWDTKGDLLFAYSGILYRLKPKLQSENIFDIEKAKVLLDMNGMKFNKKIAPAPFKKW